MITFHTINKASAQEIFDQVAQHLLTQKARALRYPEMPGATQCAYRSPDGLKCAIGCLIGDDEYLPDLEGANARHLSYHGLTKIEDETKMQILVFLQRLHDSVDIEEWPKALNSLAITFDLDPKIVSQYHGNHNS